MSDVAFYGIVVLAILVFVFSIVHNTRVRRGRGESWLSSLAGSFGDGGGGSDGGGHHHSGGDHGGGGGHGGGHH